MKGIKMKTTYISHHTVGDEIKFDYFEVDHKNRNIKSNPTVKLSFIDEQKDEDAFQIRISKYYEIEIIYGTKRSLIYAFHVLSNFNQKISCGLYESMPAFKHRGIIEGFYGRPWSHENRLDAIQFIHEHYMNMYIYAPKDDPYHRHLWREAYPLASFAKLKELIYHAQQLNVDFVFSLSPGNDFDYTKESDFEYLFKKIDAIIETGVTMYALLMDDINYALNTDAKKRFKTPGIAHAYVSNKLNQYLKSKLEKYVLMMCPTEYYQNTNTPYREDLKFNLESNIWVFWTGYNTIAEYIPNLDGQRVQSYFDHPLVLWENYPVNDMAFDRTFLGPLKNRGKYLFLNHVAMVANPMVEWHMSKLPLLTMSDYMYQPVSYDPLLSYEEALKTFLDGQDELYASLKCFAENNFHSLISYDTLKEVENAINNLDFNVLDQYFNETLAHFNALESKFKNKAFIIEAKPWFERFKMDYDLYIKINENKAIKEDTEYFNHDNKTIGTNIIVKLAKKLNLYDGPIYKKERPNYWDLKKGESNEI
jgi:hyaluronoglucosaminidase